MSNRVINGNASVLSPRSAATISDSVVEWLTADCFLDKAQSGKKLVGPCNAQNTPETAKTSLVLGWLDPPQIRSNISEVELDICNVDCIDDFETFLYIPILSYRFDIFKFDFLMRVSSMLPIEHLESSMSALQRDANTSFDTGN